MTEANKKTFKQLGIVAAVFAAYIVFVHVVPDGSIAKKILAGLMVAALVFGIIFFTGLGNPIKKLYRKIRGIKD